MRRLLKRTLNALGADIVQLPAPFTLAKHLQELLPRLGVTCVLDVGGNEGQYGCLLRQIGYRGWIVSFEPSPQNLPVLRAKAAQDGRWLVYALALGDRPDLLDLHVYANSQLNSMLAIADNVAHIPAAEAAVAGTVRVEVARLDETFPGIERTTGAVSYFLKSDTQGYDLNVLNGAEHVLDRIEGVQVELALKPFYAGAPHYEQMTAAIREHGFVATGFFPVAFDPDGTLVEVDYVARRVRASRGSTSS